MDYVVHQPSKALIEPSKFPGQVVLVFQGGGALGAYQGGVYQALHEAGIEPDWVIGTSIGAINGAIIAGNEVPERLPRLHAFWERIESRPLWSDTPWGRLVGHAAAYWNTLLAAFRAISHRTAPWPGGQTPWSGLSMRPSTRPTAYARQWPSSWTTLDHVLASAAVPPGFPAIRIDGDPYWDGGLYSNTPVEVVFDDNPRHDSVVFSVQIFPIAGPEPESLLQVLSRQKDIAFASRADSHIPRQEHIHQLRHMVRELVRMMPEAQRERRP